MRMPPDPRAKTILNPRGAGYARTVVADLAREMGQGVPTADQNVIVANIVRPAGRAL